MVLATGAMGYQYASTRDVITSEVQAGATRLAMLLLESWKGQGGDIGFDPVLEFGSDINIQSGSGGPAVPNNSVNSPMSLLDYYEAELNGRYYYVTLSYENETSSEPMILNTAVAWTSDFSQGVLSGDDPFVRYSTYLVSY
jgi:hypothetical protein